jgi:hypothetical protein
LISSPRLLRVQIPQRVPVGFHSARIPGDQLRARY